MKKTKQTTVKADIYYESKLYYFKHFVIIKRDADAPM